MGFMVKFKEKMQRRIQFNQFKIESIIIINFPFQYMFSTLSNIYYYCGSLCMIGAKDWSQIGRKIILNSA